MKSARAALGLLLALSIASPAAATLRNVDWIVAIVDNSIVTYTKLIEEMRITASKMGLSLSNMAPDDEEKLAQDTLDKLVADAVLVEEARRRGVAATPAEIDKETDDAVERIRSQFPTEQAFEKALATEFMTPTALRKRYADQAEDEILRRKLLEHEVRKNIRVTDSDIVSAYHGRSVEIRPRHILVEERSTAEAVRKRLLAGENFGVVSSSVKNLEAADLGWSRRGRLVTPFENTAFALKVGEISEVVETEFGFHVIELLDRREVALPTFNDELKEEITNEIFARRYGEALREYIEEVRGTAYVQVRENFHLPIP